MTTGVDEDEPDLARVDVQPELFTALVEGYLSEAGSMLTDTERSLLVTGGIVITYEQAIRFLTDYLHGDVYYRVADPEHNLRRARTQLTIVASLERQADVLTRIAARS
jgi:hypothetical protein